MNLRRIQIDGQDLQAEAQEFEARLAQAHAAHVRPLCLCGSPGVPMYVARLGERYILKRMPETGPKHDPGCDSYEAPYDLSGFGHVAGGAIQENVEDGVTRLRFDFSLSKTGAKAPPVLKEQIEAGAVKTDGSKLSLRALIHYLWDQAEFNRWRPGMAGKRNWAVIRKFLLEAAEGKTAKGKALSDVLFIPEMFNVERDAEIARRRIAFMSPTAASEGARRSLMMLIGEVKEIAPARFGHRMVVRHLPKFPFLLNEDVHRRLNGKFASELSLWGAMPDAHLTAVATFELAPTGVASIEAISLMVVTENWIPFENSYDATLLDALTRRRVSYLKGLRYSLASDRPLASVVLREDGTAPVAMYVVRPADDDAYRAALSELVNESEIAAWIWNASATDMPALPI
jgi:Protein of unknown function (DUF1173)